MMPMRLFMLFFFFFQAEDGIRDYKVTGVQTCALPICHGPPEDRGLPAFPGRGQRAPRFVPGLPVDADRRRPARGVPPRRLVRGVRPGARRVEAARGGARGSGKDGSGETTPGPLP